MTASYYSIKLAGDRIEVVAPYLPEFVRVAKANLSGRWNGSAWTFDARDAAAVRAAVRTHYGWEDGCKLVDARIRFVQGDRACCDGVYRLGRPIAKAAGRDSGARLGAGVTMEAGEVKSGGSVKNWLTVVTDGTVIIVRDVPELAVTEYIADPFEGEECEILAPVAPEKSRAEVLAEERARLVARIAEIDAGLAAA